MSTLAAIELPKVLNSAQAIGIPIALAGAVFLSLGAQFQSQGVKKVESSRQEAGTEFGAHSVLELIRTPSWLLGIVLLGVAVLLQLTSLRFAPLIVVQPLGAIALVVTAILNSRVSHVHLNRRVIRALACCVGGVAVFVTIAAFTAQDLPVSNQDLSVILLLLLMVLIVFAAVYLLFRSRIRPIWYVVGAGITSGFVASMAKTVINRLIQGQFDPFTLLSFGGVLAAGVVAVYLVQTSYAVGPPDLVVAGLTVIDPIVAVLIGVVVLGEADGAPLWAAPAFLVTGALAVFGVVQLSRFHPEVAHTDAHHDAHADASAEAPSDAPTEG